MAKRITYAVGDIHGRADLLKTLVSHCLRDAAVSGAKARFVFLGDICDRGPSSRECFDLVADTLASCGGSRLLKGNHDDLFLRCVGRRQREVAGAWLSRGGVQTLQSYFKGDLETAVRIAGSMHGDHLRMIEEADLAVEEDGLLFVHAGIDPALSLTEQSERDMMWIRDRFLGHAGLLSHVVVHGHTVVGDRPVVTENRISIDTGAVSSGRLTALRVAASRLSFLQTDGNASRVVEVEPVRLDRGFGTALDQPEVRMAA